MTRTLSILTLVLCSAVLLGASVVMKHSSLAHATSTTAQQDDERVAKVKAAYLLNFIKFTVWPEDRFKDESSPIVLAIVGKDPLGTVLDATFNGKKIHGRHVEIRRVAIPEALRAPEPDDSDASIVAFRTTLQSAHAVYIPGKELDLTTTLVDLVHTTPTVTIGDGPRQVQRGCMLGFMLQDRKLVFTANHDSINKSGLKLSSKLLRLARPLPNE